MKICTWCLKGDAEGKVPFHDCPNGHGFERPVPDGVLADLIECAFMCGYVRGIPTARAQEVDEEFADWLEHAAPPEAKQLFIGKKT